MNQHAAPKTTAAMMVAKLPVVANLLVALKTAAATTVAIRVVTRLAVLPPRVVAVCSNVSSTASPLLVAAMTLAIAATMDAMFPAVVSPLVALPLWNPLPSFSLLPQLKNRPHVVLILPPSERVKSPFDEQAT